MTAWPGTAPGSSPLESASARRADVERAVGILMVTEACGGPVALMILRERAHLARLSIAELAVATILAAGAGPPPDDATPRW